MKTSKKPKLAVWKFASCDGCQLTLLDCEDELLAVADGLQVAYFPEASREEIKGPYDVSLVEGSVTTPHDAERIQKIRKMSKVVVSIGACATAGGIQALRNYQDVQSFTSIVYANPRFIDTLKNSTPIAHHIPVEFELRGCPISKRQLIEILSAYLNERRPNLPGDSVCLECKRAGNVCVMVARGEPCMGPIVHEGCGALCPSFDRGCYGCFGPMKSPNTAALSKVWGNRLGVGSEDLVRAFRSFNAYADAFRLESDYHERAKNES